MAMFKSTRKIVPVLWPWRKQNESIHSIDLDPLTVAAEKLQMLMGSGAITAVEIVRICLDQIFKYDDYLKAIISRNPNALKSAAFLDEERARGRVRGPLHGIPIIVKDNIDTGPQMGLQTTAGSFALKKSKAFKAAPIIDMLIKAGVVIIGKSQLSEFAFYKGSSLPAGWSAIRGQSQSPYTIGDVQQDGPLGHSNPGGSSTGSAIAVAAGYAPIAIGTDTTGSVIIPATRAALYGLRITTGAVSMEGIVPLSRALDSVGLMAKNVGDLRNLLCAIINPADNISSTEMDRHAPWSGMRVGVVAPEKWKFEESLAKPNPEAEKQIIRETRRAYKAIEDGASFFKEIELLPAGEISGDGNMNIFDLLKNDFEQDIDDYLRGLKRSKVRTLREIIAFNKKHALKELPPGYVVQDLLENAVGANMGEKSRGALLSQVQKKCREEGIEKALQLHELDVILGPADSAFNLLVCGGGYPSATMPLSYLSYNGRPFGVFAIARRNNERLLLHVMEAWEKTFQARRPPPLL